VRRWTGRLTSVALVTLALAAMGTSAAHGSCPIHDVVCRLDEAASTGEGLVDDTIDAVDTPFDGAIDPVTDPLVDDVFDRIHDLLGDAPIDPIDLPDPIGDGGGGSHGGPPVGDRPPHTPDPTDRGSRGTIVGRGPDGAGIADSFGPTISAASGTRPAGRVDRFENPFGEALAGVARSLAIVLALFGLAVAFVAIQDRFDRTDPRLALAPIDSDEVEFV
jgi:hypothetical protein